MLRFLRSAPFTFTLILANVIVFIVCALSIGTFEEPDWTLGLFAWGANFAPLSLDKEWYRMFTSMFLHRDIVHLASNMFGLYVAGSVVEEVVGTKKFLAIYFLSGLAAVLSSSYFSLFTVAVGASGAIFGVFGFLVVLDIYRSRQQQVSVAPVLINFAIFLAVNLAISQAVRADNAAHFGGLAAGILLGAVSIWRSDFTRLRFEYILLAILMAIYFVMPRFQVMYYKFFQGILVTEQRERAPLGNLSDDDYIQVFRDRSAAWDSLAQVLNNQSTVPEALAEDTFNLRRYIALKQKINDYRVTMLTRESYIYLDSMDIAEDSVGSYNKLQYVLNFKLSEPADTTVIRAPQREAVRVWYDKNWVEITSPPATYYRVGYRDSVGHWQGTVRDYYSTGAVQMRGQYQDNLKDGIFIYYSDHNTYESAGRYSRDRNIGKWENYHHNGRLQSEVYFGERYFLKSLWDSTGQQQVANGNGKATEYYTNGTVKEEGEYRNGYKDGYWYGRYEDGLPFYQENYYQGRLTKGRSQNRQGKVFVYDERSLYPFPTLGYEKLQQSLNNEAAKLSPAVHGRVKLSFRVTASGVLTDFTIEKSLTTEYDQVAERIVREGPAWTPARLRGQIPTDGYAVVDIDF